MIPTGFAYYCTSLKNITLPDSVTSVGSYAFEFCIQLTKADLGASVVTIDRYAFDYTLSLTSFTVPATAKEFGRKIFGDYYAACTVTTPQDSPFAQYVTDNYDGLNFKDPTTKKAYTPSSGAVKAYTQLDYELGMTVKDFTVTLTDGTDVTLSALLETHKAVLINIWATWCEPCIKELPYMNEVYNEYKDEIAVLCLSPYDDSEAITAFMQENNLTLPMGYDSVGLSELL